MVSPVQIPVTNIGVFLVVLYYSELDCNWLESDCIFEVSRGDESSKLTVFGLTYNPHFCTKHEGHTDGKPNKVKSHYITNSPN